MDIEYTVMQLITFAGEAKSLAIEAIRCARNNDLNGAKELIAESQVKMTEAHKFQTDLIFSETGGEKIQVSLLMVHAQDHVMNAMTVKDMASEMVEIIAKFSQQN